MLVGVVIWSSGTGLGASGVRFLRVPVGRLEESRGGGETKRGGASSAGMAVEPVYMSSRCTGGKYGDTKHKSDGNAGSKRPVSSNRVLLEGAPNS